VCTFTTDPTQPSLVSGVLDIALQEEYIAEFLVGFRRLPAGQYGTISAANIRITDTMGKPLTAYTRLESVGIGGSAGGAAYSPVSAIIVDPDTVFVNPEISLATMPLGSSQRVRLLTYTKFIGNGPSGQAESDEFEFAVDVCNGCLIQFTDDPSQPSPNCVGNGASPPPANVPCVVGQDAPVDCRSCATLVKACQGVSPSVGDGG
jgi:hypothetical protein